DDFRLGKASLIQHLSGSIAEISQIARVDPHASQLFSSFPKLLPHLYGIFHAVQRIISIHQKKAIVGKRFRVGPKCLQFLIKGHDPAVGMGTRYRYSKKLPRHNVTDRKSTRLNSSHVKISYAVFCLKKKKDRQKQLQ